MSVDDCPGTTGFMCLGGWLYTPCGGMVFPTNKTCPVCHPAALPDLSQEANSNTDGG